jgi:hypothetical protein
MFGLVIVNMYGTYIFFEPQELKRSTLVYITRRTGTIFYILLVDKYVLTLQHSAVSILGAAMLIHKHQVDDQGSK